MIAPLEDSLAEGEVQIDDAQDEDVAPARHVASPSQPSQEEVERHRVDHNPFRSWCKQCVEGRGLGSPHIAVTEQSMVPVVGMDYFFVTAEGLKRRDELACELSEEGEEKIAAARKRGDIIKCLLVRCFNSKNIFAHVVPQKGDDEEGYCAGLVVNDVLWLGHTCVILKSDNEAAVLALRRRAARSLKLAEHMKNVQEESPAAYDSQSNGGTEVGVRIIRGMFRTLKLCLEARLNKYLPVNHPITAWLLEHTCMLLNARARGSDGQTPWQRIKGRAFRQLLLCFGERILYKLPSKGPSSMPDGNMGSRWREGVFLGFNRSSNTYIVATSEGVANVRSLYRRPAANRLDFEAISKIAATPWSTRDKPEAEVRFQDPDGEHREAATRNICPVPKAFRINYADLTTYGFTKDCPQCDFNMLHQKSKPGQAHTAMCRRRILDAMMATPEGRRRLEVYEDKVDHAIADRGPEYKWQTGGARVELAPPPGPQPRAEDEQPRREAVPNREEFARHEPMRESRVGVWGPMGGPTDELPSETPGSSSAVDRHTDDNEAQEEWHGDIEMGFVGFMRDPESSALLERLGYVEDEDEFVAQIGNDNKHVVSEIYSPPRITQELKIRRSKFRNLAPGLAFDLTVKDPDDGQPWDFSLKSKRDKARRILQESKPILLIGSPMCTAFSTWQRINWAKTDRPEEMRRAHFQACAHMQFVAQLYLDQILDGRYFLHEHPKHASSWELECMRRLRLIPGVNVVRGDQCQYGAEAPHGPNKGSPVLKPTGFMSNSAEVLREMSRRCSGKGSQCSRPTGGRHTPCQGNICKDMAKYLRELCKAVLRGISAQLRVDGRLVSGCYGVQVADDSSDMKQLCGPEQGYSGCFKDDITGQVLRDDLVVEARAKELEFFTSKGVWVKVPRQRAFDRTGRPPISVRWVDVNKGDDVEPNVRSRLVARQLKALDTSGTSYFAPAPPLEALRTIISLAMTRIKTHQPIWDPRSPKRQQISGLDVVRAYFNAKIDRENAPSFVELLAEDPDKGRLCGELLRHMYGTRPAADGWQEEYSTCLVRLGFVQGKSSANVFHHREKHIALSVHGDDLTATGPKDALDWYEAAISSEYEVKIHPRMGPGKDDAKEMRVLNRVITWHEAHIEYEADPRQAERLIEECGLTGSNPVGTPGAKTSFQEHEADKPLETAMTTPFRGSAARGNYLSADRCDIQFGGKEVCRSMATPTVLSWKALKRMGRYLCGRPRLVYMYRQQELSHIDTYVDTDWAGCVRTRKSTSGGAIMLGKHCIKHWSSTQPSVSLSSGEAEFYGVVRGAGQGLGYQALLGDLGVSVPLRVWTDSSAALGICSRQGLGKLRHLDTHTLWVQQAVRSKRIDLKKVLGEENPADLFTKHSLSKERLDKLVALFDCQFREGRAKSAPAMRTGASGKQTIAGADRPAEPVLGMEGFGRCEPRMPHTEMGNEELDLTYPSLEAVDELELHDLTRLEDELLYGAGMKVVQTILNEMATNGRTRKAMQEPNTEVSGKQRRQHEQNTEVSGEQVVKSLLYSKNSRVWGQILSRRSERFPWAVGKAQVLKDQCAD